MRRAVALAAVSLLLSLPSAGCGGAGPSPGSGPAGGEEATSAPDRSGPHAGVPDLVLPETERHRELRRGLEARLSFHRAGGEKPDLLQRIALDHLEEAEEAERAALRVTAWIAETGSYPEAEALRARLAEQARTNRAAAITLLRRVLAEYPDAEHADGALYTLATALARSGERDEALALERRLVAQHPDSELAPDALLDLGDAAYEAGSLAEARDRYEAIRDRPDAAVRPFATYKLGWVHWNLGEPGRARALLGEVAQLPLASAEDPLWALRRAARRDFAVLYAETGAPSAAPSQFRAIAGDDAPVMLAALARAYAEAGKLADARATWSLLLEGAEPCDPATLGWLRMRFQAALLLDRRDLFFEDADAWVARLDQVAACARRGAAARHADERRAGVADLREVLTRWQAEAAATRAVDDVSRLEAIVEGLDPEDPPPEVR